MFFDENGGFFTFVCEMDTFLSAMYWMCVCREVSTHLQVVMSHIEVLQ